MRNSNTLDLNNRCDNLDWSYDVDGNIRIPEIPMDVVFDMANMISAEVKDLRADGVRYPLQMLLLGLIEEIDKELQLDKLPKFLIAALLCAETTFDMVTEFNSTQDKNVKCYC